MATFLDFTDGGQGALGDYIAGYAAGAGAGSDRRWLRSVFADPPTDDGDSLGTTSLKWSDVFLGSGAVINFNSSDVLITHAANQLTFSGATSGGYRFDFQVVPTSNDAASLGTATISWSDLFLAAAGVINWNNGVASIAEASTRINILTKNLAIGAAAISAGLTNCGVIYAAQITPSASEAAALQLSPEFIPFNTGPIYGIAIAPGMQAGATTATKYIGIRSETYGKGAGNTVGDCIGIQADAQTDGSTMNRSFYAPGGTSEFNGLVILDSMYVGTTGADPGLGFISWSSGQITLGDNGSGNLTLTTTAPFGSLILKNTDPGTFGVSLILEHATASPANGDIIGQITWRGRDTGSPDVAQDYGAISLTASDVTNGSEDSQMTFQVKRAGANNNLIYDGLSGAIYVIPDNTMALGLTSNQFADLYLAAGGVIGWSGGTVTLTESSGNLTYSQGVNGGFVIENTNAGSFGPYMTFVAASASPATNDFVGQLFFSGRDVGSPDVSQTYASLQIKIADVTDGSEDGDWIFSVMAGGNPSGRVITFSGLNAHFSPTTGIVALGTTAAMWSNLFLASGATINYNAGNYTVLHDNTRVSLSFSGIVACMAAAPPTDVTGNLQVLGTTAGASQAYIGRYSNDANDADIIFLKSRGATIGSHTIVQANDEVGIVGFNASNGTNFDQLANIKAFVDGTPGASNDMPGRLTFATKPDNSASAPIIRLTIDAAGVLNVGTAGSVKLAAGTTTVAPLSFQAGTNLTTAADGAMEFDGQALFFSPDASDRRILPAIAITKLHAAYTLTSNTNVQKMFNASANGALTLPTGAYIFECVVGIDTMSATSGNAALSLKGAGTATVTNYLQVVGGIDGAKATAGAAGGVSWSVTDNVPAADTSVVTAGVATEMAIVWKGSFEVTAAGTIIPSVDLITANAAVVKIGSYFMVWRMGTDTTATVGNWS